MDVNALASQYGSGSTGNDKSSTPTVEDSKIHDLAAQYGSDEKAKEVGDTIKKGERLYVSPHPPISGFSPEQSAALNTRVPVQGTVQPYEPNPISPAVIIPQVASDIGQNFVQGGQRIGEGLGNIVNEGAPLTGAKNIGLGALQAVTAIPAGVASGAVGQPVTQLTGNPDIGDRAALVAGSALPIVPGAGLVAGLPTSVSGLAKRANALKPSNAALKDLTEIISNNGANPENLVKVVQGMKANPRLGPADLNPAVLSTAQKLFTTEGDTAKNYLAGASANRMATAPQAVTSAFDTAAGMPVNAVQKLKQLKEAAQKVGREQINPAVTNAKPVDISPVIENIDNILKPGVMKQVTGESTLPFNETKKVLSTIKSTMANSKEQLTDAQALHRLQSALRVEAEARLSSSSGAERQIGKALMNIRNDVVDAIDKASPRAKATENETLKAHGFSDAQIAQLPDGPLKTKTVETLNKAYGEVPSERGSYKPALSNFREEKQIDEAFHDAYNGVLSNSKALENRPEFTEEWIKGMSPEEKEAAKEGIRTKIDSEMGTSQNPSLAGQKLGRSDFNKQKMEMLLGKEETKSLLDKLEAERSIANTHNKIVENSQTAMRLAGESRIKLPEPTKKTLLEHSVFPLAAGALEAGSHYVGGQVGLGTVGLAASLGASKLGSIAKDKIKMALAKEKNLQLAKMSLPTQGPERDALIQALSDAIPGPKQSLLRRGAGTLSRIVGP